MKNLIITILCVASLSSCNRMKINKTTGEKKITKNAAHLQKVNKKSKAFYAGNNLIKF